MTRSPALPGGRAAAGPWAGLELLEKIAGWQAAGALTCQDRQPAAAQAAGPQPARPRRHRPRHRKPAATARASLHARRAAALTTLAAVTATGAAGPVLAAGSGNVTQTMGRDPTVLNGDSYECTLSPLQMTAVDGSEAGNVRVFTRPGHLFLDVNKGGTRGSWNDAYLSEGVNPDGYDSTRCDGWGYGTSDQLPVPASDAGPVSMTVKLHTVAGFKGDGGLDVWLTTSRGKAPSGAPWASGHVTARDMMSSPRTTEIMVWLNSPGIWRGGYASLGWVTIGGRRWEVLYYDGHSARHPWNYVVFAAPEATSRDTWTAVHNLALQPLIQFAADRGLVAGDALLQAVDTGAEWYEDPSGGTQVKVSIRGLR